MKIPENRFWVENNMPLKAQEIILLNQLAQCVIALDHGLDWFRKQSPIEQTAVLQSLVAMARQAHPISEDLAAAAHQFGCKLTHTPAVLLSKGRFSEQAAKVLILPADENEKSFRLLLGMLAVADARRKASRCVDGCTHWWHRDLAHPKVVEDILESGEF